MDKDQSRGSCASRGRGRASSRSSEHTPLRPLPSGFTFSRPLLADSAQPTGDGLGPSSSPPRITHIGDGSRPSSSSPPHSEHRDDGEAEIEPSLDHVREEDGATYIIPDETSIGFIPSRTAVYSASSSTFVLQAEYDLMRHRVAELTEEVSTQQQQMTELIQSLQAKIEKMEKCRKNKRKTNNNEDTDSSTDTDND